MKKLPVTLKLWAAWLGQKSLRALQARLEKSPAAIKKLLIPPKRYRVNPGRPNQLVILLVGCGGTGSWTAHILAQFVSWAQSQSIATRLYFIDPDRVEGKNLVRQNFCQAELGYPKAFTLAWRYNAAFGLQITPVVGKFQGEMLSDYRPHYTAAGQSVMTLIIGAVDNSAARRDIAQAITQRLADGWDQHHRLWWIDAGNERDTGQILAGNSLEPEPQLSPLGFCVSLPFPHLQEPGLLAERLATASDLSCAELGLLAEQSAVINRQMATWIGVYLYRLLQSRDLDIMATWLDLAGGQTRSIPITGGRLLEPRRHPAPPPDIIPLPVNLLPGEEFEEVDELECPNCHTQQLIEGETDYHGARILVRFCTNCNYREEGCPNCWGEIEEAQRLDERGHPVPILRCFDCNWTHDIELPPPDAGEEPAV